MTLRIAIAGIAGRMRQALVNAAAGGDFTHLQQRLVQQRHRLRQVEDVDVGFLAEDEAIHLRIPTVGLVTKVRASFQELTHAEFRQRHKSFLFRFAAAGET